MAGIFYRGLLQGATGGGGGGGGGSGATPYDDNFDVGSSIDTAGTRFAGANPWIKYNTTNAPTNASFTVSGGLLTMNSGSFATNGDVRVVYQNSFPAGDCRFRAKITAQDNNSPFPHAGIILRESATTKWLIPGLNSNAYEGRRGSGTNTWNSNYTGGANVATATTTFYVEVERSGSNLILRLTDDATDGEDLTTALATARTTVAQTADFTTAPDQIGLNVSGAFHVALVDWFLRLA